MVKLTHIVKDPLGIHARPAGLLVRLCSDYKSDIVVSKGEKHGDAKKIFSIMALAVKCGDEITVEISGEDESVTGDALKKFLHEML